MSARRLLIFLMMLLLTDPGDLNFGIALVCLSRKQVYLETDEPMKPGVSYAIRIKFQYKLSEHLEGFYISTYKDKDGNER